VEPEKGTELRTLDIRGILFVEDPYETFIHLLRGREVGSKVYVDVNTPR